MAYDNKHNPTNPDAVPLYNDSVFKFWNWFDKVWNCNDWMTWHDAVKKKYGKVKADNTFLYHWNNLAFLSSAIDCRTFNKSFRDYMRKEGLLSKLYGAEGIVLQPAGAVTDVSAGVSSGVSSVASGVSSAGKVIKSLLPLAILVLILYFGFIAYKKYSKA